MASELVVFTCEHADRASEVLAHIAELKRENIQKPLVGVEDAAVAVKGQDGNVRIRQTLEGAMKTSTCSAPASRPKQQQRSRRQPSRPRSRH